MVYQLIQSAADRHDIELAIASSAQITFFLGRNGQQGIYARPHSHLVIAYHPSENKTYWHNDTLRYEDYGNVLGF